MQNLSECLQLLGFNLYKRARGQTGACVSGPLQSMIYTVLTKKKKKCVLNSKCSLLSQAKMEGQEQLLGVQVLDEFFLSRKKEREKERHSLAGYPKSTQASFHPAPASSL